MANGSELLTTEFVRFSDSGRPGGGGSAGLSESVAALDARLVWKMRVSVVWRTGECFAAATGRVVCRVRPAWPMSNGSDAVPRQCEPSAPRKAFHGDWRGELQVCIALIPRHGRGLRCVDMLKGAGLMMFGRLDGRRPGEFFL